jgi:3-deoxy-7-phosphoheptulonate synthase
MLIVMKKGTTQVELDLVTQTVQTMGFRAHILPGVERSAIGVTGNSTPLDPTRFENLPGVAQVIPIGRPSGWPLAKTKPDDTVVRLGSRALGLGQGAFIIAGPCAVEREDQVIEIAR